MEHQIVVARYNEDISYLYLLSNIIIIYNKGDDNIPKYYNSIKLPNIGRESHTYLYHIINNYDTLATITLFIQGRVSDHKLLPIMEYFKDNKFIGRESTYDIEMLKDYIQHNGKYLKELKNKDLKKSKYTPYQWINKIGLNIENLKKFKMVWGANFSVSKDMIHKKPKIFYENLIKYLEYDKNPEEGHFFERSWSIIFNHPLFITKKRILYEYIFDINDTIIDKCKNILINNNDIEEIHLWTNNTTYKDLQIRYININKYVIINPLINDNSFVIKITDDLIFIKLEFENNITYEIHFNNNIEIYKENKLIICCKKKELLNIDITIKWLNNILLLLNDKIVILYLINETNHLNLINIKMKGYSSNLNYNSNFLEKIFIFQIENNKVNKNFYKDNYEDYYIEQLNFIS